MLAMRRLSRFRLRELEDRLHPHGPLIGRLLFLIPDLWPEADQAVFHAPRDQGELEVLILRRTGVRPTLGMQPVWAIVVPASDDMLALNEADKAAFLERYETRPRRPDRWEGRTRAVDDSTSIAGGQAPSGG